MEMLISLAIWIACIIGCHEIAQNNNRNTTIAVIMGVLFGLFAVIVYAIIGKPKE